MQAQADVKLAKIKAEEQVRSRCRDTSRREKRSDEIQIQLAQIAADRASDQQANIEADKELTLKEMELKAQDQISTNAVVEPPHNRHALSTKLPAFIDEKDELDSYLLRFERFSENA